MLTLRKGGAMNIIEILTKALVAHGKKHTSQSLGDRTTYVGLSDIARASDCLRAVVADKVCPKLGSPSLNQMLTLERGHWFEHGVARAFANHDQPFLYQLEINTHDQGVPLRGHLDFVFLTQDAVHIVECKSCDQIPKNIYGSYEMQLYGQMGLLQKYWNKPCFRLPGYAAQMSLPELVKEKYGMELSQHADDIAITGSFLCLSMNEAQVFGPYCPNQTMLTAVLNLADDIWKTAQAVRAGHMELGDVATVKGHHLLCDYCQANHDCPRFDGITETEIEEDLQTLTILKDQKKEVSDRIKDEEERIKALCRARLPDGGWLRGETLRVRLSNINGRATIDKDLLYSHMTQILDGSTAATIIDAARRTGKGYEQLYLGKIN